MLGRKIARHGMAILATALIGGFLSATLVRLAPGFDVDEGQIDPHLSSESIQALRQARVEQRNIFHFYFRRSGHDHDVFRRSVPVPGNHAAGCAFEHN